MCMYNRSLESNISAHCILYLHRIASHRIASKIETQIQTQSYPQSINKHVDVRNGVYMYKYRYRMKIDKRRKER